MTIGQTLQLARLGHPKTRSHKIVLVTFNPLVGRKTYGAVAMARLMSAESLLINSADRAGREKGKGNVE